MKRWIWVVVGMLVMLGPAMWPVMACAAAAAASTDLIVPLNVTQLLGAIGILTGTYAVPLIRALYAKLRNGNQMFGPFAAIASGLAVTTLAKATGLPISTDFLTNLSPDSWTAFLTSSGVVTGVATILHGWNKGLQQTFDATHPIGSALRAIGGDQTATQIPTPAPLTAG